jgi:hypothetical protein
MLAPIALAAAVLAGASQALAQPPAGESDRALIAVLPYGTTVEQVSGAGGIAPGIMSAGLGAVPATQTYLDITQGNRVNERLYDGELPRLVVRDAGVPAGLWKRTVARAESAPADVIPGLLAQTLEQAGIATSVEESSGSPALIGADEAGGVDVSAADRCGPRGCGPGLSVIRVDLAELRSMAARRRPDDLLIAFAAAPPKQALLPIGIAGPGFDGDLTSDSTRTDGVVTATDLAPTLLEHFGVEEPDEFNGSTIRSEGEPNPGGVADLQRRLDDRAARDLVVLLPLGIWALIAALCALLLGRRGARHGLALLGLSCAWAPLLLLVAAAFDLGEAESALLFGAGSPALAAATWILVPGYRGLALAAGVTVGAHALDVIAGSPLTALSVLGPNPAGGVRFFGIGNELEATLTTLTLIGAGAMLATLPRLRPRSAAIAFAAVAVVATAAFAPGRFGADVGAAIVLGAGGAAAAALALGLSTWRTVALVLGAGLLGLVALVAVDSLFGGAHFSRSVLGAGEASDVVDVVDRRLRLMADTFTDPVYPELLVAAVAALALGLLKRDAVLGWFGEHWPARCGFVGALAGVLIGTVANDSGSVLFVIGTIYIVVSAGFFWAETQSVSAEAGEAGEARRR